MFGKREKVVLVLGILSGGVLLISNIAAAKLWDFLGIAVDGGIICFPLSYVLGDLVIEFSDFETSKVIVISGLILNVFAAVVFAMVGVLPAYPGWGGNEAFVTTLSFSGRIIVGSLSAYLLSSLVNNRVFVYLRKKYGEEKVAVRVLNSSFVARIVDTVIFESVAFFGVLSVHEFLKQMVFAYFAGAALEILLFPITKLVIVKIDNYLNNGLSA